MSDEPLEADMRLSMVSGVGPLTRQALIAEFGSAGEVMQASPAALRGVKGVGPKLAEAIIAGREIDVAAEIDLCGEHGISILTDTSDAYPKLLTEIPDPPALLFGQGEFAPQDGVAIAMVGSRHCTRYGEQVAESLAGSLARAGVTIISGLARGIDGAAHRGALNAGGRTIAVLGSGLLNVYPPEHQELARDVAASGVLLSEHPPRAKPLAGAFPQRNRIVTGMSLGVIVVEAALRSGALISARHAMEQNREVFAVPGRVDQRTSRGCHRLIRDGAKLVETADDVLEELGPLMETAEVGTGDEAFTVRHPAELQLNEQEQQVLQAIGTDPTSIDEVAHNSGLPIARVLSTLSVLEMRHLITRISGSLVARR